MRRERNFDENVRVVFKRSAHAYRRSEISFAARWPTIFLDPLCRLDSLEEGEEEEEEEGTKTISPSFSLPHVGVLVLSSYETFSVKKHT